MIYFDNSATTLPDEDILQKYYETATKYFGNPSSSHGVGGKAALELAQARGRCAVSLGVNPEEIIFVANASEGNNTMLKGLGMGQCLQGKHIITTKVEHASVYETCKELEGRGCSVTYLPTDNKGCISLRDVMREVCEETILVAVMYVNSELGSIQPIAEIGRFLSEKPKIHFHVDAVQGFGKLPLTPKEWGIDSLSLSAHKFHGLRGAGLLYVRGGTTFSPLINGGGQEFGHRAGTENLPAIVAMSIGMEKQTLQQAENYLYLSTLKKSLLADLKEIPGCLINSAEEDKISAPHIINFSLPNFTSEEILLALEEAEIYVSKSSACSAKSKKPSRVLLAAGISEEVANSAIRVSFSTYNTLEEVDSFVLTLQMMVTRLGMK